MKSIGQVAEQISVSVHTLRYYEKEGLLSPVAKDSGGRRQYGDKEIKRLKFIKRAQRMHFTLDEIRQLIQIDQGSKSANPTTKPQARKMVQEKLTQIEESLQDLNQLKLDLSQMLTACVGSSDDEDCPILGGIKEL